MQDTTIAQAIEAIAEKYGYDMENEYIPDWEVTRANAYKQMSILTNAGRITSTILEYAYGSQLAQGIPILNNAIQAGGQALSKLPILNKVGAEKITNVLGDTMLDTMYDTIPEAIRNVQGGKSAQEVTTATLKSVGKNVADNIVGEAALSFVKGKIKAGYEKSSGNYAYQGGNSSVRDLINNSDNAKKWGILEDGTNQGTRHFSDYWEKYPERIPALEQRLGVETGTFNNSLEGFNNFTNQAERVINEATISGNVRNINGKAIYYIDGTANSKKGIVVIVKDGKLQSMMPSDIKSFNKLQ